MPCFLVFCFVNTSTLLPLCLFSQEPFQSMEATVVAEALKFLCDEGCRCYKIHITPILTGVGQHGFKFASNASQTCSYSLLCRKKQDRMRGCMFSKDTGICTDSHI